MTSRMTARRRSKMLAKLPSLLASGDLQSMSSQQDQPSQEESLHCPEEGGWRYLAQGGDWVEGTNTSPLPPSRTCSSQTGAHNVASSPFQTDRPSHPPQDVHNQPAKVQATIAPTPQPVPPAAPDSDTGNWSRGKDSHSHQLSNTVWVKVHVLQSCTYALPLRQWSSVHIAPQFVFYLANSEVAF